MFPGPEHSSCFMARAPQSLACPFAFFAQAEQDVHPKPYRIWIWTRLQPFCGWQRSWLFKVTSWMSQISHCKRKGKDWLPSHVSSVAAKHINRPQEWTTFHCSCIHSTTRARAWEGGHGADNDNQSYSALMCTHLINVFPPF